MTELGRHVPQRPPGDMDTTVAQAQDMLRACNTADRYKRCRPACAFARSSDTELPERDGQQTASQAVHTAENTRVQSGQAPVKRTVIDRATETFRTTWIKKEPVKIQLTKIKFDTHLTRGHTKERDEDSVLSRIASLRTNPPCRPISNILIWQNEGTLPSCHTHIGIFTHSCRLGTAVPISLISSISHLPVVHFCLS